MKIKLLWPEVVMCAGVGVQRKVTSIRSSLKPLHYFKGHLGFEIDVQGACGELAVAKALGLYWGGSINTFKQPDVGPYQVRLRMGEYPYLALRHTDADDDITILVTGMAPEFEIKGWIRNKDGKKKKYFRVLQKGRPPTYAVPEAALLPLSKLPAA